MAHQSSPDNEAKSGNDVRHVVRHAIEEFLRAEQTAAEPAYKTELIEERKRREGLESRLNQLIEENRVARQVAEETDRHSQIRSELQRLGIAKIDLAFRAVKDEIVRSEEGKLQTKGAESKPLAEYLTAFLQENPELLPARIAGGSGAQGTSRNAVLGELGGFEMDKIRPGMSQEDRDRVRQEISHFAAQSIRNL